MLHKRHTIRLHRLDYSLPNHFFVTICCKHHGCYIGQEPTIKIVIENEINNLSKYFSNVSINEIAIMPNHIHLIIEIKYQIKDTGLGKIIRVLKSKITNSWLKIIKERKLNTTASIWQRNYFEHRIRDKTELFRYIKYIRNNPTNWDKDRYNPTGFKAHNL